MLEEKKAELRAFGQKLYEMRSRKNLSQMQLADIVDVDRRQISRYENGEAEMGALLYAKIQSALSVQIDNQLSELLQLWGTLSEENKAQLLNLAKIMNRAQSK